MATKKFKPTSPGRRFMSVSTFDEITKTEPERSLLAPLTSKGGRNSQGRITVRHRGGGHKRKYRIIDFRRDKDGIPAKVVAIEYDPNRSANIALLQYENVIFWRQSDWAWFPGHVWRSRNFGNAMPILCRWCHHHNIRRSLARVDSW